MEFITVDMFTTLAGCMAVVMIITQVIKTYLKKTNPLLINFLCSLVIGVTRIFIIRDFSYNGILTGILNIFVIMAAAGGSYDTIKSIIGKMKEE